MAAPTQCLLCVPCVSAVLQRVQETLAGLQPESVSLWLQELITWCFEFSRHSRPSFQQIQEALLDLLDKGPHNPLMSRSRSGA